MAKECAYFTPDTFRQSPNDIGHDQTNVDGVSITLGRQPRKHIWMYAVERGQKFVGNHFYFETASNNTSKKTWYVKNLLWDGLWCPHGSSCCFSNTLGPPSAWALTEAAFYLPYYRTRDHHGPSRASVTRKPLTCANL